MSVIARIVEDKLTVQAGVVIAVDALLLTVLVRFAIEIRAFLLVRFPAISSFGNMAASLVFLIVTGLLERFRCRSFGRCSVGDRYAVNHEFRLGAWLFLGVFGEARGRRFMEVNECN